MVLAVIPARGGSKGIKHKNLQKFGDSNLIGRSIQKLLESETIDEVWVSSDSDKIKDFVTENFPSVKIHHRSAYNASEFASTEGAVLEFLSARNATEGLIIIVQCTSPFLEVEALDDGVRTLQSNPFYASALSVSPTHKFVWKEYEDLEAETVGIPLTYDPGKRNRRQDMKQEIYLETGAFYITRVKEFLSAGHRLPEPVYLAKQVEEYSAWEIDSKKDLSVLRYIRRVMGG